MHPTPCDATRRRFLVRVVDILGIAALIVTTVGVTSRAIAKVGKGQFMYQDHPHDGKSCAQCKYFAADNGNPSIGSCEIVDGTISRAGWCMAFAGKA